MIEKVIARKNMRLACSHVVSNNGSAGVDGMRVSELTTFVKINRDQIATALIQGKYIPQSILGVSIPKSKGKTRLLGIPTVIDRWLQQSVSQVMSAKFEMEFKKYSYGFRPGKNALQAVQQAQEYIHEGYQHIVDIGLQNFPPMADGSLSVTSIVVQKGKMSGHAAPDSKMVESADGNQRQTDQTQKRRTTGKSFKSVVV